MLAYLSVAVYFVLMLAGAAYGFNIDRFAGVIGAFPGFFGIVMLMASREMIEASLERHEQRNRARRIAKYRKDARKRTHAVYN